MDTLPDGVLLEIMSILDHQSLVRFGRTTHRHLALSSQECLWKRAALLKNLVAGPETC